MKTWFITGTSRGLGRALAEAALARGDVVIGATRGSSAAVADEGRRFHAMRLDVADAAAVQDAVDAAFAEHGRIDVLVNNAGYGLLGAVEDATDAEIAQLFEVNVFGPLRLIRAALPHLRAQGSGHIVNVTSIAGRAPMAASGAYAAAKAAMEGLSQSLAQEVAPLGLRVTAVAPGGFRTDFLNDRSIRRSAGGTGAYAGSVGAALAHLDAVAGRQLGDPARAATAILAAVDADAPPLRLLLGTDALRRTREAIDATLGEMVAWEATTSSTDFAVGA